ncbi:hypothetical protein [Natronococcus wangiae]|uniref:hypothetical protein n=1 Tax=Natronococcus wangiae TaxID=3068275 RepID=UPI00273D8945|nr:hypothetical protein [Natronococcus sp. AD5]
MGNMIEVGYELKEKIENEKLSIPMPEDIHRLFVQQSFNSEFRHKFFSTVYPLVPYEDYFKYLKRQDARAQSEVEAGIGVGPSPKSLYWCSLCAATIPNPVPADEIVFCLLCAACAVGPM